MTDQYDAMARKFIEDEIGAYDGSCTICERRAGFLAALLRDTVEQTAGAVRTRHAAWLRDYGKYVSHHGKYVSQHGGYLEEQFAEAIESGEADREGQAIILRNREKTS
jgi:hypothetical protein